MYAVILQAELRLIEQDELLLRQRGLQIRRERVILKDLLVHTRCEELEIVAPLLLGLIHRDIRVVEQRHRLGGIGWKQRDSDARGDGQLSLLHLERLAEAFDDGVCDRLELDWAVDVLEEHCKLVSAEAGQQVAGAHAAFQACDDGPQQLIPQMVPEGVVDHLESIEVEKQQGYLLVRAQRMRRRTFQLVAKILAVRDTG